MSVQEKFNIRTLGVPQRIKCPKCKKSYRLGFDERRALADCMMYNSCGLWALSHCKHCGWVDTIYPTAINGISCTEEECKKLFDEMNTYANKHGLMGKFEV